MQATKDIINGNVAVNQTLQTMKDIAFQTNILSLNIAIESTHAGKYRREFAVVTAHK